MTVQEQKNLNKKYFRDLGDKKCFPEVKNKNCFRCTWDNGVECQCTFARKDQWKCLDYCPEE